MPTTYEPFDHERFDRELKSVMSAAMKKACEDDRDQIIKNIKGAASPLGGAQKTNAIATLKRKKGSTPLIGEKRRLVKKGNYGIFKIREPDVVGWELVPREPHILIALARLGYPVFWLDASQVWLGEAAIAEALQRMSDSFRGAPR